MKRSFVVIPFVEEKLQTHDGMDGEALTNLIQDLLGGAELTDDIGAELCVDADQAMAYIENMAISKEDETEDEEE